jgi:hypothetical protein
MPLTCLLNRLKEEPHNDVFVKLDVFGKLFEYEALTKALKFSGSLMIDI